MKFCTQWKFCDFFFLDSETRAQTPKWNQVFRMRLLASTFDIFALILLLLHLQM